MNMGHACKEQTRTSKIDSRYSPVIDSRGSDSLCFVSRILENHSSCDRILKKNIRPVCRYVEIMFFGRSVEECWAGGHECGGFSDISKQHERRFPYYFFCGLDGNFFIL